MTDSDDRPPLEQLVDVHVRGLPRAQAYALAQLCKRIGWTECRANAVDEAECRLMIAATDRMRTALEDAGVYVR